MKRVRIVALSIGVMLCGQVTAQETEKKHDPEKLFIKIDTNGDGSIDKTEFKAAVEKREIKKDKDIDADKQFAKADTNGDGLISKAEFIARKDEMKAKRDEKTEDKG